MFRVFFGALIAVSTITVGQANVLVTIDKSSQQMTVAVDGKERWAWPVSTGRGGYATPSGSFPPFRLEKDHFSEEWDEAPMPHSIFFTTKGHAIHGTFDKRRLGSPASHGCVRLAPENAAKLFALVKDRGLANTKVVVANSESRRPKAKPVQPIDQPPAQPLPDVFYVTPPQGRSNTRLIRVAPIATTDKLVGLPFRRIAFAYLRFL